MNPFADIFSNIFSNTIFAPPRAVQGAEAAGRLAAEAEVEKEMLRRKLAEGQGRVLSTIGTEMLANPGQRIRTIQELSSKGLLSDYLANDGKFDELMKFIEMGTPEPFKQDNIAPGGELHVPNLAGEGMLYRRNPTTAQVDTLDMQKQAKARADGIGMLSQWLKPGVPRTQVYQKAIGNKAFRKLYFEDGLGKDEDLKTLIEGGTPKPLEPTTLSPGEGIQVPNPEGTGFASGPQQPTAQTQLYNEVEAKHGPEVAQWLFHNAGPNMNPTEKQVNLREFLKANPGNKELENIARKVDLGLIVSESVLNPLTGKMEPSFRDYTKQGASAPAAPVSQSQLVPTDPQAPFVKHFTPPNPMSKDTTLTAGEAAFELGPPGAVQKFFNDVLAPTGFAKTDIKREDAEAAFGTLADVTREYFQNNGRPLAADAQLTISRLPKTGGFTKGFFQTPLKTLSQLKSLRNQIERDMNYHGRLIAKAAAGAKMSPELVEKSQVGFTNAELALEYYPTAEEFKVYEERAKQAEAKGPKGVKDEIMKRWNESFQGGTDLYDFMEGDTGKPETLKEEEKRLLRELRATEQSDEETNEPHDNLKEILSPNPIKRQKEIQEELKKLELQKQGSMPVPIGNGQYAEPAAEQLTLGADGSVVTIDQRMQELKAEDAAIEDQKALHRRQTFTMLESNRWEQITGVPKEVFYSAAGIQSEISNIIALPAAVVRMALTAIGAAKIMNPDWQSGRSTESLMKDYFQRQGNGVEIPEGSLAGQVGEGAMLGASLAFGIGVMGPRIVAAKGPKALAAAKNWIGRLMTAAPADAVVSGASSGAAATVGERLAKDAGSGPVGQAVASIVAGTLAPGKSIVTALSRGAPVKQQTTKLRTAGEGATLVKSYGQAMQTAVNKKVAHQKGVLETFTEMDADKAIDAAMSGTFFVRGKPYRKNPEAAMLGLRAATMKDKDASEGLRRGTLDWIFKKTGLFGREFNAEAFAKVWKDPTTRRAYTAVLPPSTIKRIDDVLDAEATVFTGAKTPGKPKPLRNAIAGGVAVDVMTGSPGLATALFVGRVMFAQTGKKAGADTLQGQAAFAQVGKSAAQRFYNKVFPRSMDLPTMFREALLDPKFEATLLKRAGLVELRATKKAAKAAQENRGFGLGVVETVDDDGGGASGIKAEDYEGFPGFDVEGAGVRGASE